MLGVSDHLKTVLETNSASAAATTAMKTPAEAMPPACRILVPKPRRSGGRRQPHLAQLPAPQLQSIYRGTRPRARVWLWGAAAPAILPRCTLSCRY